MYIVSMKTKGQNRLDVKDHLGVTLSKTIPVSYSYSKQITTLLINKVDSKTIDVVVVDLF